MKRLWICQRGAYIFFNTVSYNFWLTILSSHLLCQPAFNTAGAKQERWELDVPHFPPTQNRGKLCKRKRKTRIRHPQPLPYSDTLPGEFKTEPCLLMLPCQKHLMNLQFQTAAYELFTVEPSTKAHYQFCTRHNSYLCPDVPELRCLPPGAVLPLSRLSPEDAHTAHRLGPDTPGGLPVVRLLTNSFRCPQLPPSCLS